MVSTSQYFMSEAIKYARTAFNNQEVPVGAVIVHQGVIIAASYNQIVKNSNATHHAEILALSNAMQKLKTRYLNECDIYSTLEPCPMCAYAISLSRIKRLYFGALDVKGGGVYNGPEVFKYSNHIPEIYEGILADQSSEILKDFFQNRR